MKSYEVWMEGYAATGEHGTAQHLGNTTAASFKEACKLVVENKNWDMSYYNPERNTYWGCRFFDNGEDARKSFG